MHLDLSALLWQRRVALLNTPRGYVRIVLTAQDLSNFMVHPLMSNAASKAVQVKQQQLCEPWRGVSDSSPAVQAQPFVFQQDSVVITAQQVLFSGAWQGRTYDVIMSPVTGSGYGRDESALQVTASVAGGDTVDQGACWLDAVPNIASSMPPTRSPLPGLGLGSHVRHCTCRGQCRGTGVGPVLWRFGAGPAGHRDLSPFADARHLQPVSSSTINWRCSIGIIICQARAPCTTLGVRLSFAHLVRSVQQGCRGAVPPGDPNECAVEGLAPSQHGILILSCPPALCSPANLRQCSACASTCELCSIRFNSSICWRVRSPSTETTVHTATQWAMYVDDACLCA
jgi:hypothetical protein